MNRKPIPAIAPIARMYVTAAAALLRLSPRRMNHSTAGLSASARKIETSTQEITSRVIARIESSAQAAITSAITVRTDRTLKRTTRSSLTGQASPSPRTVYVGWRYGYRDAPHQPRRDRDRALPRGRAQDRRELHQARRGRLLRRR